MNKDKAIQLLERLQDPEPYEPMLTKDAYDAIQMAIDALSADGDTISRKAAIEVIDSFNVFEPRCDQIKLEQMIGELPPANNSEIPNSSDTISRQAIDKFIDGLEEIFANIREQHIDDSVCGLCEYDGAYIGQSGDWCNECPGFDKDDCFKLSDKTRKKWTEEIIKALTPIQYVNNSETPNSSDTISRQAAIKILHEAFDAADQIADVPFGVYQNYRDKMNELPPAQLEPYTDALKAEIKRMKRSFTICINSDYYTGYMSALSAVEGYIAQMEVTT